jgi:hypothetical protein
LTDSPTARASEGSSADPCEELHERLVAMREALIAGLAASPVIEGGHLALLGHVGAALAALAVGLRDT